MSVFSLQGGSTTCFLTRRGDVVCFGACASGQCGIGTTQNTMPLSESVVLSNVAAISVSASHTCALTNTGDVRCWGLVPNGTALTTVRSPPAEDALRGVAQVATGLLFTCVLMSPATTGGLRCWGVNYVSFCSTTHASDFCQLDSMLCDAPAVWPTWPRGQDKRANSA